LNDFRSIDLRVLWPVVKLNPIRIPIPPILKSGEGKEMEGGRPISISLLPGVQGYSL
jgi:hypothetical protein